jgi:hypothetical protein
MKKLAVLLQDKSFEKGRLGKFPYTAFAKLESLLKAKV